ncbi:hypothetical protein OG250_23670 [Streptomyces sp. NBC_00487]|uniref:hypothetical protein n=1 Tax=unclassified Streptomyces TaxID=2593676 RepID=UPI002DD859A6|nr:MULTISPECIES: hypothetical protein [unclassified Streptomyces]WRY97587.1 hypothetical protein OG889_24455 [Streptomyces sp. NBC_00481]
MPNKSQKFQVDIDGIDLPDEVVQRLDAAVRKAVLIELAAVNLDGRSVDLLGQGFAVESLGRPGHTQGLRVRTMEV